jgi:hypothetical protein
VGRQQRLDGRAELRLSGTGGIEERGPFGRRPGQGFVKESFFGHGFPSALRSEGVTIDSCAEIRTAAPRILSLLPADAQFAAQPGAGENPVPIGRAGRNAREGLSGKNAGINLLDSKRQDRCLFGGEVLHRLSIQV